MLLPLCFLGQIRNKNSRAGVAESWVRAWSKPPPMLADMSAGMWIEKAGCHADLYTVSRCCTRGESGDHRGEKVPKKGIHPGFDTQGRYHQKSKTGVSVAPRKGLMPPPQKKRIHSAVFVKFSRGQL